MRSVLAPAQAEASGGRHGLCGFYECQDLDGPVGDLAILQLAMQGATFVQLLAVLLVEGASNFESFLPRLCRRVAYLALLMVVAARTIKAFDTAFHDDDWVAVLFRVKPCVSVCYILACGRCVGCGSLGC